MDATDRAIIDQLRHDARLANTDLADRVGLTPAPCLRRVRRLEAEGVITGYHAHIDPEAIGRGFEVVMHIALQRKDRDSILAFESQVMKFREVIEARRMFGALDYVLRVATADLESFEAFAVDRLSAIPGVMRVESLLTMKVLKRELG